MSTDMEIQLKLELAQLVSDFKKPGQVLSFLTLFLSETELSILAKRLAIFKRLNQGKSYEEIQRDLGVSSATVSSVAQLKNESFAKTVMEQVTAQDWAQETATKLRGFFSKKQA